jgi:hypothetical protein
MPPRPPQGWDAAISRLQDHDCRKARMEVTISMIAHRLKRWFPHWILLPRYVKITLDPLLTAVSMSLPHSHTAPLLVLDVAGQLLFAASHCRKNRRHRVVEQRPGLTVGGMAWDVDGGPDVNCVHWFMKTMFRLSALLGYSTRAALESGLQFVLRYSLSYPLQCFCLIVLGQIVCYFLSLSVK